MKVVYRQRVSDQLLSALSEAAAEGREIQNVQLTYDEWDRLCRENGSHLFMQYTISPHLRRQAGESLGLAFGVVLVADESWA